MNLKLKKSYEEHPVAGEESLPEDVFFHLQHIRMEIDEVNVKNLVLIEVGCGKGSLGTFVSDSCQQYIGIDFSLTALKFAKKKRKDNMCYVCANASFLPFKEKIFDIVLCSEVLEHIPKYAKVLLECFFILKPFGKFLVTVPNRYNPNVFSSLLLTKKGVGGQEYDNPPAFPKLLRQLIANGFKIDKFYSFYSSFKSHIIPEILTNRLAKITIFPFGLYIFIRATRIRT